MPALQLCGRKWALAADDLALPSLCGILIRITWLAVLLFVTSAINRAVDTCAVGAKDARTVSVLRSTRLYLTCSFCLYGTTLLVFVGVLVSSLQGTIIDVKSRAVVTQLLYLLFFLIIVEIPLTAFGVVVAFVQSNGLIINCASPTPQHHNLTFSWALLQILVCTVICEIAVFHTCTWATMSSQPLKPYSLLDGDEDDMDTDFAILEEGHRHARFSSEDYAETRAVWEQRCKMGCRCFQVITCNLFGGIDRETNSGFQEVAMVMARYFKGLDLVASDLVASLLLIRAEQRHEEAEQIERLLDKQLLRRTSSTTPSTVSPTQQHDPTDNVHEWLWGDGHRVFESQARSRLHIQQARESRAAIRKHPSNGEVPLHVLDERAVAAVDDAEYYGSYMLGIYGWMLFTYMKPHNGICRLFCSNWSCSQDSQRESHSMGMGEKGCCSMDYTALRQKTGLRDEDIVYTSFTSYCGRSVPYCIAVDHKKKSVVIACRGTMSIADLITDALMHPEPLHEYGSRWGFTEWLDENSHAHSGMARVAAWIREDIERVGVLDTLFTAHQLRAPHGATGQRHGMRSTVGQLPDCHDYDLVVLGHSLGAGVASVLSLMLLPRYQRMRCIAFSPPGCTFDKALADRSSGWISSPFVGKDLVVRASWHTLTKLKAQMLEMLRRSKANKNSVLRSAIGKCDANALIWAENMVPDNLYTRSLARRIEEIAAQRHPLDKIRMYAPGKLLHFSKVETIRQSCRCLPKQVGCCTREKAQFVPMWVDDRTVLDEFLVSHRMALDHFPDYVDKVIREVNADFGGQREE